MAVPLVVGVILNTNRRADTLECLASLRRGDYPNFRAVVLDNASTDGSVEAIRAAFPETVVVELTENLGYAGNNNTGLKAALDLGAEWVFVLNEDVILDPAAVSALIAAAGSQPEIGIAGPLVLHHSEPGIIQSAGGLMDARWQAYHRGENQPDQGQYASPDRVDWISGCALLVRRQVIEQVGGLDARYFYYWEETEWCLRARRAGWQVLFVPQARIWHKGVQRDYQPSPNVTYYATRNRLLTLAKHRAPLAARAQAWWITLRTLAAWTWKPRWRSKRAHRDAMWQGVRDYLRRRWGMRSA
jgi:GT2 family glycosyltransferase